MYIYIYVYINFIPTECWSPFQDDFQTLLVGFSFHVRVVSHGLLLADWWRCDNVCCVGAFLAQLATRQAPPPDYRKNDNRLLPICKRLREVRQLSLLPRQFPSPGFDTQYSRSEQRILIISTFSNQKINYSKLIINCMFALAKTINNR